MVIKKFKDVNGKTVNIGDTVSVIDPSVYPLDKGKQLDGVWEVCEINKGRQCFKVTVKNAVTETTAQSTLIISEM